MAVTAIPRRRARMPGRIGILQDVDRRTGALMLVIEIAVLLVLWQVLVGGLRVINPVFLPPPLTTLAGFGDLLASGTLGAQVGASVTAWLIGYGLSVVVGIVVGLVIGSTFAADRLTSPFIWTLYATPWLAYQPLSKAWFGFGLGPIIFLVFMGSVFPLLLNTAGGIRTVNRGLVNAGRIFGATRPQLYRKVLLPGTMPFILVGMRQSAVMATIALIVAEMTTSSTGMGALIVFTANTYKTGQSFAAIMMVVAWSFLITQLIGLLARLIAPWTRAGRRA